jgi:hypothetical protein
VLSTFQRYMLSQSLASTLKTEVAYTSETSKDIQFSQQLNQYQQWPTVKPQRRWLVSVLHRGYAFRTLDSVFRTCQHNRLLDDTAVPRPTTPSLANLFTYDLINLTSIKLKL